MQNTQITTVTKDVVESGRKVAGNLISTGRNGARRALNGCDLAWRTGTNALSTKRAPISAKLRDDLNSLESQLTLIAGYLLASAADRSEQVVNNMAESAGSTVGHYERVFDLRVMQSLVRIGMPVAELARTLAARIASISQELTLLVAEQGDVAVAAAGHTGSRASNAKRATARQSGRARATAK